MTCHEVVTWPVTKLSHDLSQCHMTCHNVTWPVIKLSHDLSWCCHMTCHDAVTWHVMMSHDLSWCHMTCLSHGWHLYNVFYFWHVPLKHGMRKGSTPSNLLWWRKRPSRIIEQHVNINLIEFCSSYQPHPLVIQIRTTRTWICYMCPKI